MPPSHDPLKIVKDAIGAIDTLKLLPNVIVFQHNPDALTRVLQTSVICRGLDR
jgi:hypothetical protein